MAKLDLGNLASRFLVALVAAPLLLFAMYSETDLYAWALVFLVSLLAMNEFFAMGQSRTSDRIVSLMCGGASVAALYWLPGTQGTLASIVLAVLPVSLFLLFCFGDIDTAAPRLANAIVGIFYGGMLLTFLALLKRDFSSHGGHYVIIVLLIAWMGDTGGYFAGKLIGGPKLYAAISPGKTWAGAIGGLTASTLAMIAVKLWIAGPAITWFDVIALAVPGSILGQLGDLVESMIKRSAKVKDSGALLPGHGGILDRVDAVLFISPYVYLYLSVRPAGVL